MSLRYVGPLLRVASALLGVALVAVFFEWPIDRLIPVAVALLAVEVFRYAEDRFEFNRGWAKLPLGAAVLGLGALGLDGDGALWAITLFVLLGCWLVLDALVDLRTGALEHPPADSLRFVQDTGVVYRACRAEPRTPAELATDLDRPLERIERALDALQRRNRVEETEGVYYPEPGGDRDLVGRSTSVLRRAGRRLARPLELVP